MMAAKSSLCSIIKSNQRRRMTARSFPVLARQVGHEASAASVAARVSLSPISGTVSMTAPVAGSETEALPPRVASIHAPFT